MRYFLILLATALSGCAGQDPVGLRPLVSAARRGDIDAMTMLLDAGADVNEYDAHNGWTPLLHAIHKQRPAAVRLLLERGADPNLASLGHVTPLLMAADDPDPTIVKLLLAGGADPHAVGRGGRTPLGQAVSGGALTDLTDRPLFGGCHPAAVREFMTHDRGQRVPHDPAGREAIWWARFHGCEEVLALIGEPQTKTGQTLISLIGMLHDEFRPTPQDAPPQTPATADPDRR